MKIGIVTQPLLNNYGGVLQNFALQHTLRSLGHQPITLDYIPRISRGRIVKLWLRAHRHNLLHSEKVAVPTSRILKPRHPYFESFVRRHIALSDTIHTFDRQLVERYGLEAVITGSDQVWRPCYNRPVLTNMFLDFVGDGVQRVAYAASFGVDFWEYKARKERKCRRLAQRLDGVSVREESGIALCREHLGVEATEVLDPTLLVPQSAYSEVCSSIPQSKESFVGAYILDQTPAKVALVKEEARRRGVAYRIYGAGADVELTVEEWLAMFRDAECIITDSFHGCVFSIIFRKEFAAIINKSRGASRFISLFGKFSLQHRIIEDAEQATMPSTAIDWAAVEQGIAKWQEKSLNYLTKALCRK